MIKKKLLSEIEEIIFNEKVNSLSESQLLKKIKALKSSSSFLILGAYVLELLSRQSNYCTDTWIYIESDSIYAISRDTKNKTITIVFNGNTSLGYIYSDIPDDIWTAFISSPSKGKFYLKNIKNKYKSLTRYVSV